MTKPKRPFARLGKYIVEIVIIIIGISLSFALSDFEKKQASKADYQSYLKKLQRDIHIDSLQMVNDIGVYGSKINAVDLIFKFHPGFSQDSISMLGQAQNNLLNFVEFLPNDNTFQILSSTGDFKVFTNDSLVSELFQLYRFNYSFINMLGREANEERLSYVKPYLVDAIFFEDEITFPKVRTNIPAVIQDRKFRNICLQYKQSSYGAINAYRSALNRLARINQIITSEIEE